MTELVPEVIQSEYETLIAGLGERASAEQIVTALIQDAARTERGAWELLKLAQSYGTSILRNALALAHAMQIEDGELGP